MRSVDRPALLVAVVGATAAARSGEALIPVLARLKQAGVAVAVRVPAQSYEPGGPPSLAEALGRATGEPADTVCLPHRWYESSLPPALGAEALGRDPGSVAELFAEIHLHPATAMGVLVLGDGPGTPIASDGGAADLCTKLQPDAIVLVADAAIDPVSATMLAAARLAGPMLAVALPAGVEPAVLDWLSERFEVTVGDDDLAEWLIGLLGVRPTG